MTQIKNFLGNGVANGFNIVDRDARVVPMEIDNHPSASPGSELFNLVKQQVCVSSGHSYIRKLLQVNGVY